jgi:hypothetical protein
MKTKSHWTVVNLTVCSQTDAEKARTSTQPDGLVSEGSKPTTPEPVRPHTPESSASERASKAPSPKRVAAPSPPTVSTPSPPPVHKETDKKEEEGEKPSAVVTVTSDADPVTVIDDSKVGIV